MSEALEQQCPNCYDDDQTVVMVEPEQDSHTEWWECAECGFAWGYHLIADSATAGDNACQVGIPEDVRRAASDSPLLNIGMPTRHAH